MNSCCSKIQSEEESCKPYCKGDIRVVSLTELKSFTDTLKLGSLQDEMTIEERVMILVKAECIDDDFLMYENVYYDFTADSEHIELWNNAAQHFRVSNTIRSYYTDLLISSPGHYSHLFSLFLCLIQLSAVAA